MFICLCFQKAEEDAAAAAAAAEAAAAAAEAAEPETDKEQTAAAKDRSSTLTGAPNLDTLAEEDEEPEPEPPKVRLHVCGACSGVHMVFSRNLIEGIGFLCDPMLMLWVGVHFDGLVWR